MGGDERLLHGLNPEQLQAAQCLEHCLVVACPGSGKTKTLAAKAAFLLSQGARVAAVTFTRDAALELRGRTVALAGEGSNDRLLVGTFHSIDMLMAFPKARTPFGTSILSRMRSPFGSRNWDIVREGERRGYVRRALAEAGIKLDMDEASRLIEDAKANNRESALEDSHRTFIATYQQILSRNGQIDFQDILLKTNAALADGSLTPLAVEYLLIDEYQDTDEVQYEWIKMHAAAGCRLTCVGDDDQSIYGFRRALGYACMERLVKDLKADTILLGVNYRCHGEILGAAGKMVQSNRGRIDKTLRANKGLGGAVEWERFGDFELESEACLVGVEDALRDQATIAVLARSNRRLDLIEGLLVARDLPYRRADGESVLDKPEVALFGSLIETVAQCTPRAIDQVLGWAGVFEADLRQIRQLFGNTVRIGAKQDFERTDLSSDAIASWTDFAKRHAAWSDLNEKGLYRIMLHGMKEWLTLHAKDEKSKRMVEIAASIFSPSGISPRERLEGLRLASRQRRTREAATGQPVSLMTAHSSKGLEFDRVWILGAEDEAWPSKNGSLEEERRLMYVAMTRARERLTVSAAGQRPTSPFVAESGIPRAPEGKYRSRAGG